ncbi:TRAP transporter large permease [Ornithinimicrobium cavernae]|uniref:TRAP transporter large permease n=1 Tax=Ornithinimicrobium cavernae TaxID=2666047 RepID=UPI000D69FAF3|nr:TRAP transporter large permease [Ornithinimicrobium cavernae]
MPALLFGSLLFCFAIGVPIAVALGFATLLTVYASDTFGLVVIPQQIFNAMNSFPLMAIPFFILAGFLMQEGGISERLVDFAKAIVGHLTGGLAMVVVVTSMFFAAISGSGAATTAAIGSIMIPAMVAAGYNLRYAGAIQATSGALGVIIPPSIPLIIYAIAANTSVGDMFMAGVIPGLVITLSLLIASYVVARRRGYTGTPERADLRTVARSFSRAILALIMPVLVLGGIYGGVFTPTEAAVIAVAYSLVVGLVIYRRIRLRDLPEIFTKSALTTAIVMIVIGTAGLFGFLLNILGIPDDIAAFFLDANFNVVMFLLVVNLLLLVAGMFIEAAAAILILTPILLPVATELGVDPVHFGVIMVVNLAIGLITPPVGINLFVAAQIADLSIVKISRAIVPYVIILFVDVLLITYLPALSTWLPGLLAGE